MSLRLYIVRSRITSFFMRYKMFVRRIYWFCAIAAGILIFAIPISMGIRNPYVQLPDFHGPSPVVAEIIREWNRAMNQAQQEQGRLNDFVVLVNHLSENYPFIELASRQSGIDYIELAVTVFDELAEVVRYEIASGFFSDFVTERYLSLLGRFGGLRLTGELRTTPPWITQPYFFGYYDWRFYDNRFDIPVRDGNITSVILDEGILYLRVNTFLPKGYEIVTRNPFWYFCIDADKQYLMDLYINLYVIDDLIIDIRGIGSGFRDYFIPLILAPHLHEPMNTEFYAFHSESSFSNRVSFAYRTWYGLGEISDKDTLAVGFTYDLPENVTMGFPAAVTAESFGDMAFRGRIWLLTDSDNFSGPNFVYLQMARDAGFFIIYEENPESIGWAASFIHLPHSGLSVRSNPLYFTDATGRPFEETGIIYDYRIDNWRELMGVTLPGITGNT